jgi:Cysteine-rich CPXCG
VRKKRASAGAPRRGGPRLTPYGCAFCGEENEVFADPSGGRRQAFTEDCTVCCRPNLIALTVDDDGDVYLQVTQEYEA